MKSGRWLKWALLGLGTGMVIYGVATGQATATLRKAILICLECMGLGV